MSSTVPGVTTSGAWLWPAPRQRSASPDPAAPRTAATTSSSPATRAIARGCARIRPDQLLQCGTDQRAARANPAPTRMRTRTVVPWPGELSTR